MAPRRSGQRDGRLDFRVWLVTGLERCWMQITYICSCVPFVSISIHWISRGALRIRLAATCGALKITRSWVEVQFLWFLILVFMGDQEEIYWSLDDTWSLGCTRVENSYETNKSIYRSSGSSGDPWLISPCMRRHLRRGTRLAAGPQLVLSRCLKGQCWVVVLASSNLTRWGVKRWSWWVLHKHDSSV